MRADRQLPAVYRRVVIDTNVILSASLSPDGVPATLLNELLANGQLVMSRNSFAELETRLWRTKFDRYLSKERRHDILKSVRLDALWFEPAMTARYSRDPDDDMFVALALAANVKRLITGDDDLLCLDPLVTDIGELRILTPRAALDEIA